MKPAGKWIETLPAATPIADAIHEILKRRVGTVLDLLETAGRAGETDPVLVHALRVAARRTEAALRLLGTRVDHRDAGAGALDKLRRLVRRVRRASVAARDADVHLALFRELHDRAAHPQAAVVEYLIDRTRRSRLDAERALLMAVGGFRDAAVRRLRRRTVRAAGDRRDGTGDTIGEVGRAALSDPIGGVRRAAAGDLHDAGNLHALRLASKRLRYSLELAAPGVKPGVVAAVYPRLVELQDHLGEVNDIETVLVRLEWEIARIEDKMGRAEAGRCPAAAFLPGLRLLRERYACLRDRRAERFAAWWPSLALLDLLDTLDESIREPRDARAAAMTAGSANDERTDGVAGNGNQVTVPAASPGASVGTEEDSGAKRLAAIDIGSNSARLVIAEAYGDGTYRILDDEKELTRLAQGLARTGRLDPMVMEHAATVVGRLRAIAEGYRCVMVRAVATAAVREASNGAEFADLVRARAGLDLRIISAEEEGRLAYQSVAHAFGDMRTLNAGVLDIGGGSTEVVLSSRGVIEEVSTLRMGAVSVTERFDRPERSAGKRFKAMRKWIRHEVRRGLRHAEFSPDLLVGTGGTITTMAAVAIKRDRSIRADASGLAPSTVQGYQIRYSAIRDMLDNLRDMTLAERAGVPGLSAERADIIVAGIAIVEAVMRRLGVRRLRVHNFGVRDGLLQSMIREAFPGALAAAEPTPTQRRAGRLGVARRFAQLCRYEERHSEHVAALALQILDGLGPLLPRPENLWTEPVARELLEAAAVLHDAGYIINYAQHHKHAYHLIIHADLSGEAGGGFTRREVQILANVARYHRRSEPKDKHPNFAALGEEDRRLVRRLAAVLRVADGLDRTHTQNVRAVRVRLEAGAAVFELHAQADPATDAWGASRKAGLFRRAFGLDTRFEWRREVMAARGSAPLATIPLPEVKRPAQSPLAPLEQER